MIDTYNFLLERFYPYHLMKAYEDRANLTLCTDAINYHLFQCIHLRSDSLFQNDFMKTFNTCKKSREQLGRVD